MYWVMATSAKAPKLLLATLVALFAVLLVRNAGDAAAWPAWTTYLYNVIQIGAVAACLWRTIAVRAERAAWAAMTLGLASFAAGDVYWAAAFLDTPADDIPYPSIADALYLALYPCMYVAIGLLLRARAGQISGAQWLDGIISALGVAAVSSALLVSVIQDGTGGDTLTVATNLAYPIGDLVLLLLLAAVVGAVGRGADATWWVLAAGFAIFGLGDSLYLVQASEGSYVVDGVLDTVWPLSFVLFAAAGWLRRQPHATRRLEGWRTLIGPGVASICAVAVVAQDHYARLPALSIWLAAATLIALIVRLGLLTRTHRRMLVAAEVDARTDALTGLPNRRELVDALQWLENRRWPAVLALYDLDGFKAYNDRFGHPAGDALLQRLSRRLEAAVPSPGQAFRIGGDEFCIITAPDRAGDVLVAATAALSEHGEGFQITASCGSVALPDEAPDAARALTLVDQRMYANKRSGRASPIAQARDVLLRAVAERSPDLAGHVGDVAGLAVLVAHRLGLTGEEVERIRAAAALHDVGKLAIPDAILDKAGPLDDHEWSFMQRHTLVGERILAAAPALIPVAPLVRASHERWDGGGYPDGLTGEEIPLGARIVAVCDAWDAMTTDRAYRAALQPLAAMAELRRCAGSQFDPAVVAAVDEVLAGAGERCPVAAPLAA
jgi:diguanylate cyclase (GGDEF)-like protein